MEVFQVQSPSHSTASTHLDLDPRGLFLHRGCSSGTHCPVISPLLRSPREPRATQHPQANHAGVTEVGAGVTQAGATAREGRNPPPVPGNHYTLELGIWRSPSVNGIKAPCLAWERHGKLLPEPSISTARVRAAWPEQAAGEADTARSKTMPCFN